MSCLRIVLPVSGSKEISSSTSSPNSSMRSAWSSYRRIDLDDVAADAEGAAGEVVVVALVLDFDELAQDLVAVDALAALERQHHAVIGLGRAQAVDARDAGDDDDVAALEQRPRRREAHAVDLVVDGRFLLDVRVGGGNVGLGLVVVVVADEVLDGVLGKEAAELLIELGGERLVVRHDQRRAVHPRDALRHGEGLARAGDAEQHLRLVAPLQPVDELVDGARLVAAQFEIGDQLESVVLRGHWNLKAYHVRRARATCDVQARAAATAGAGGRRGRHERRARSTCTWHGAPLSAPPARRQRGEVPGTGAHFGVLQIGPLHLDLHRAPRAVGARVRRGVADDVAGAHLLEDLLVQAVELLEAGRKERLPAGHRGEALQLHLRGVAVRARLVLEVAEGIQGDVRGLEQVGDVAGVDGAARVAAVGVGDEHFLAVLRRRAAQVDGERVVERRHAAGLAHADAFDQVGIVVGAEDGAAHFGVEVDQRHVDRVLVLVEELDRRGPDVLHVLIHAAAGVEQEPEVQRRRDGDVRRGEELDLLRLAPLENLEVGLRQAGDRRPAPVGDDHAEVHQIHADADRLIGGHQPGGNRREQGHAGGDGCVGHGRPPWAGGRIRRFYTR